MKTEYGTRRAYPVGGDGKYWGSPSQVLQGTGEVREAKVDRVLDQLAR